MPNVLFNTWSGAFFNPGGGEVQLRETQKHLLRRGVNVDMFDLWKPQKDFEIFHQFSIVPGVQFPMAEYRALGKKIALSTILWAEFPRGNPEGERIREILNLADIYFTNSKAESKKISRSFELSIEKFHETRNGISDEYLNCETSENFREAFKVEGDFVLSVANIDRRKNTKMLIQACRELNKKLVLVGQIRDHQYYQEITADLSEHYSYVGAVRDVAVLKSAFQQAELFALPSLCETPGIAALEAASQGCRIAITREGCAEEYFGEDATYVDPLDLNSITAGIESELKKPRQRDSIVERVCENFSWAQTASDVMSGYQKLTNGDLK